MQASYSADHYFRCLDTQFIDENFKFSMHGLAYWKSHRWAWVKRCFFNYVKFAFVASRLLRLKDATLGVRYRQQILRILRARWREPHILFIYSLTGYFIGFDGYPHFCQWPSRIARPVLRSTHCRCSAPPDARAF